MDSEQGCNEDLAYLVPFERYLPSIVSIDDLNLIERTSILVEKADAIGRIRIATANLLIEDGLMRRRRRR